MQWQESSCSGNIGQKVSTQSLEHDALTSSRLVWSDNWWLTVVDIAPR